MASLNNNLGNDHDAMLSSLVQISQLTTLINNEAEFPSHENLDTLKIPSSNKESTLKKSNKRTATQSEGKSRKRNKEHHQKDDFDAASAPKRAQVPRACSNCRRMHAGCGVERPCKRCVHNGLEATCVDVPRKKRSMKKGKSDHEGDYFIATISNATSPSSSPTIPTAKELRIKGEGDLHHVHSQIWEDTFQELYGTGNSCTSSSHSSMASLSDIDLSAPLVFGSESDDSGFLSHQSIHQHQHIHQHDLCHHSTTQEHDDDELHHDLPLPLSVHHPDDFYNNLLEEISHNNKSLESRIHSLSEELLEMKKSVPAKRRNDTIISQQAIMESPDVAVSMWIASFADLILVECDDKFVEMMGLPMQILKDNFPFSRVLERTPSDHNWPRKVQISTFSGTKDVLMTINMLTDGTTAKYFVVHALEL